jgi:hypothetical protein
MFGRPVAVSIFVARPPAGHSTVGCLGFKYSFVYVADTGFLVPPDEIGNADVFFNGGLWPEQLLQGTGGLVREPERVRGGTTVESDLIELARIL